MREINFTKQKILIFGLVVVLILAIVMIGVMFLGKKNKQVVNNIDKPSVSIDKEKGDNANGVAPEGQNNKNILKIAKGGVYGLKMKKGTNEIMFYQQQKILSADPFTGQKHPISSYPFADITEFLWSKDSSKVLLKDTGDYFVYDLGNNLTHKFRYDLDKAIWNQKGDKIIYKYYNSKTGERKISMADISGENSQLVIGDVPYRRINLMVQPGVGKICYSPFPDARVKGKLFCQSLNGENKKEYGGQYGQDYLWSPDGSKILTSFTKEESGNKLVLGVMNKIGGENRGLSFATTVKKCVWSKDNVNVYCAMLAGTPLDVMMPNAWQSGEIGSADTFWKINTNTGEKKRIIDLGKMDFVVDSENLVLDDEENFLFFVNRKDRSLWRIKL